MSKEKKDTSVNLVQVLQHGCSELFCECVCVCVCVEYTVFVMFLNGILWSVPNVTCILRIHTKKVYGTSDMFHGIQRESHAG